MISAWLIAGFLSVHAHCGTVSFDPALVEGEVSRETDLRAPYLARFEKDGLILNYVAARHETTWENETMALIRLAFEKDKPRFVILEGFSNDMGESPAGFLAFARRSCMEKACTGGEPAFAALLANASEVPFAGGEPPDSAVEAGLGKLGYTLRDISAFYFLRRVAQSRREGPLKAAGLPRLYDECLRGHPILKPGEFTYGAFKSWYKKKNGKPFEINKFEDDEVAPGSHGKYVTQGISAAIDLVRNRFTVRLLGESLSAHQNVLIVYGASHYLMSQGALEKTLGKPSYHKNKK